MNQFGRMDVWRGWGKRIRIGGEVSRPRPSGGLACVMTLQVSGRFCGRLAVVMSFQLASLDLGGVELRINITECMYGVHRSYSYEYSVVSSALCSVFRQSTVLCLPAVVLGQAARLHSWQEY